MIIPDVFFSFCVALVLATIFAFMLTRHAPRSGFAWLFLVIFLATWAGGIWGKSYGAPLWGRNVLPFLIAGILVAVLFSILAPKQPRKQGSKVYSRKETIELIEEAGQRKEMKKVAYITLNFFFWFIVISLLSVILLRYLWG